MTVALPCARVLLVTFCVAAISACNSAGTPTQASVFPLYNGIWRGTIGSVQVTINLQAQHGFGRPVLTGEGTFVNPTTSATERLFVVGIAGSESGEAFFNIFTEGEFFAGGVVRREVYMGRFTGTVGDRIWPGRYEGPRAGNRDYDSVFGVEAVAMTLRKD